MVALSVSISAITSPGWTLSPSFLSHLARLPFSMVGDSAGMRMLTGMARFRSFSASKLAIASSPVADRLRRLDHLRDRGQRELLEIGRVGHGHVLAGDAGN